MRLSGRALLLDGRVYVDGEMKHEHGSLGEGHVCPVRHSVTLASENAWTASETA